MMLSHPQQRPLQAQAKPPVDLATADLQALPSDAANLQSGVPIMSATQLPAAAGGAWARPLSAQGPAGSTAAAAAGVAAAGGAGGAAAMNWLELENTRVAAGGAGASSGVDAAQAWGVGGSRVVTGVPVGCVTGA